MIIDGFGVFVPCRKTTSLIAAAIVRRSAPNIERDSLRLGLLEAFTAF
jgi:hypothetical protein